jgi:TonB C terminal
VPKQFTYFAKLFGFSSFLHLFLIIVLFYVWQAPMNQMHRLVINRRINPASIVVLPMIKTVPGSLVALTEQQVQAKPQPVKSVAKSILKKTIAQPKKETPKSLTKKTPALAKKELPKPIASMVKQPQIAKPVEKKPPLLTKKEAQKGPISESLIVKKKIASKELVSTNSQLPVESEIIYVGRDDLVMLKNYQKVQQDIEHVWKPPVGLSKDLACMVAVDLNSNGMIKQLAVEESSNVLSFDIAARMALSQVKFPKTVWGKKLVITFKQ